MEDGLRSMVDIPTIDGGYKIIYADPPWHWKTYSKKGEGRSAKNHYDVMDLKALKALPIQDIAAQDSVLLMWAIDPMLKEALDVVEEWGFTYKTVGFYWAKLRKTVSVEVGANLNDKPWHFGTGYYTRANPEMCLLARRGKGVPRQSRSVRKLVVEPVREHSRKPDRIRGDIVDLFGDVPRLELFARSQSPGWSAWGNQTEKFT